MPSPRPFRFGVINEMVGTAAGWRERVRRAEALGYDTLLLRDHLVPDFFGDQLAPLPALAAAAALTTRLRLGTLVIANDFRHPALLAKEAATVDLLSAGRFELGLGAGWLRREYHAAGIPFDPPGRRIGRLAETVQILKRLWRGAPIRFQGEHYVIDDLTLFPPPVQRPHPPLLLGGGARKMLTLAGQEADTVGILTASVGGGVVVDDPLAKLAPRVAEQLGWVRAGAGDRFSRIELSLMPTIILTDDRRTRTEALIRERGWSSAGITPEQVRQMPSVLIGSVDDVADQLYRWREELGFSYFVVSDQSLDAVAPLVARLGGQTHPRGGNLAGSPDRAEP